MSVEIGFEADDRGVSDVVGYVLIFSLIVATVGVVTTVGFSTLEDRQDAERVNNVERAFDVLANNIEDVYRDGAPSRATEMRLAGGELRYGEPVNVTVRNGAEPSISHTIAVTPLVYTHGETRIVYTAGAVIRDDPGGSVMLRDPPYRLTPVSDSGPSVLPFIRTTRAVGPDAVARQGTVRIEAVGTNVDGTTRPDLDPSNLELVVDSPRESAWEQYLEAQAERDSDWKYQGNGVLEFQTNEISVPQFRIRLRFTA